MASRRPRSRTVGGGGNLDSTEVQMSVHLAFVDVRIAAILQGEDPRRSSPRRFLNPAGAGNTVIPMKTISFKVNDDEARRIRRQAKREGVNLSEYLRRRALGAGNAVPVTRVRCELTGAEIFAPLADSPALTTGTVREMLADFP